MLEVLKKTPVIIDIEIPKKNDVVITKTKTEIEYKETGEEIKRRKQVKVNLTKKINETAKLVKSENALLLQKMDEVEKIFTEIKEKK